MAQSLSIIYFGNTAKHIRFNLQEVVPTKKMTMRTSNKNWTDVRKILGYCRYDTDAELKKIQSLYQQKLRLMMNLFQPCGKLSKKKRVGSKVKRKYDKPMTPLTRLVRFYEQRNAPIPDKVEKMLALQNTVDPFKLSKEIDDQIRVLQARNSTENVQITG